MKKENPGIAMKLYRRERWLYTHHMKFFAKIVSRLLYIFCNCVIPPTTEIGAGAVVLRDVPDGVTVVGVPAKEISK